MSYEETQKYLPILKEISTDYRYDLGIPALSHYLGGGYNDNLKASFNSSDGTDLGYDCLEMTRDIKDDKVRYIADYEIYYNDSTLFVGSESGSVYISVPNYFPKTYTEQQFHHRYVGTVTRSAIRPILYLRDNNDTVFLDKNNYIYGCNNI